MILHGKNIFKSFQQGQKKIEVLKGLNIEVNENEKVAILGKSGSGKSTLLSLLSGLATADEGQMNFLGKDLTQLNEHELTKLRSKEIGIIFQQFHLLPHLTALENVQLIFDIQSVNDAKQRAIDLLDKMGLKDRINNFPSKLSGGEIQRVAIARALAVGPKLMLADEPSGSLDEETGEKIMNEIFSLVSEINMSLILVTHNEDLAKRCDKVYRLENGILKLI